MTSPVERRIGQVFIPVSDLDRSIAWYAALLGFEAGRTSHGHTIFDVPTDVETRLAPEDIGSVVFVQFEDPDGNPLMVCQRTS